MPKKSLTPKQSEELLKTLKTRFEKIRIVTKELIGAK